MIKKRIGIVVSNKMQKTIVVRVETKFSHKTYFKILKKTKKYLVHDPSDQCNIGDKVLIHETRPISKQKHWKLKHIISRSSFLN
jgi:small subunit ribosomal protein S17